MFSAAIVMAMIGGLCFVLGAATGLLLGLEGKGRVEIRAAQATRALAACKARAEQAEQRLAEIAGRTMERHIERAGASRKGWKTRRAKKQEAGK